MRRAIRVFVADAPTPSAKTGKKSFPQTDAVLQKASVTGGKLFAQYETQRDSLS